MASDDDLEVDIEFDVNDDKVTPKLGRMEKAVARLDKAVNNATARFNQMVGGVGAVAGIFGLHQSISGAKAYIDHVDRIANLTGLAADRVAGMSEAMQISGVEAGEVEGIMMRMTKKSALLDENNKAAAKSAARYGINLKEGPEKSLVKISKLVEEGKLGAGQVGRIVGAQGQTLANLMDFVSKGPAKVGEMLDDAIAKNAFLKGETLDAMQSYDESVNRVGLAWKRVWAKVIVTMAPKLEGMASKMEDAIERIGPKIEKMATFLVDHMEEIVSLAKTYAKFMIVNTVSQKLTGAGIIANMAKVGKAPGAVGGKLGALGGIGSTLASFFTGATKLMPIIAALGKLSFIGAVFGAVAGVIKYIATATEGVGKTFRDLFGSMWNNIKGIGRQIAKVFSEDSALGKFFRWLGGKFVGLLEIIASIFNRIIYGLRVAAVMITERVGMEKAKKMIVEQEFTDSGYESYYKKGWGMQDYQGRMSRPGGAITPAMRKEYLEFEAAYKKYEAATGVKMYQEADLARMRKRLGIKDENKSTPEKADVYQDFRGSKFDITQDFSDVDPDRVAVGFANDLASIGERKVQSGFAPLFTIR